MNPSASTAVTEPLKRDLETCLGPWCYYASIGEVVLTESGAHIHGLSTTRARFTEWLNSIDSDDRSELVAKIQVALETKEGFCCQYRVQMPDQSVRQVLIACEANHDVNPTSGALNGMLVDQTERFQYELDLLLSTRAALQQLDERVRAHKESDERDACSRAIVESAIDGIITINALGVIVNVNRATERIFGYGAEELIGQNVKMLMPAPYLAEHDGYLENYRRTTIKKVIGIGREVVGKRKDGSTFPLDLAVIEVDVGGRTLFVGTTRDISERKSAEAEIRMLNEQLEQRVVKRTSELTTANKELDAFAYSVSHDLRAPLRHIDGFLELLAMKLDDKLDEQSRHYINVVLDSSRKMGDLIDDLLAFSRMSRTQLTASNVDLNALIASVIQQLQPDLEGREIEWKIDDLPVTKADAALLGTVWMNLIQNAVKFTRHSSAAKIEIGKRDESTGFHTFYVKDNGVGFNMKYADKLFGVFQRLHSEDEFEGTGIGLASVRRIIQRHGGVTWAESEPGQGATFYFCLPAEGE